MRTGVDTRTGKVLTGWDHCVQSIDRCLRTRLASRVMRRHLGSLVPELQDANADPVTIFNLYRSIADALNDPDGGEPGYSLRTIELVEYGRAGRFAFLLTGIYFPRGHLGDFGIREQRDVTWGMA
tara:strand:- start:27158 stop:27532 length:375 start_codon:yes stop_codon:yes gene_type:complete